ncbi:MAG TPA: Clp protease N-terminal domain-containing protein [Verrucomicrobiae bacterium]|nr:Clp protease N-terminal domain-containing protein [Verrucomicrobiae bacterium]
MAPFTPRARKAPELAGREARVFHQPAIHPDHILLGLLREGSGVAAVALKNLGIRAELLRAEVSHVTA